VLDRRFDHVHHAGRVHERHLEINLCELWLAVASATLIAVASGKLKVTVDPTCMCMAADSDQNAEMRHRETEDATNAPAISICLYCCGLCTRA
jgi:hypothetical protein